jgi:hypothetical protein
MNKQRIGHVQSQITRTPQGEDIKMVLQGVSKILDMYGCIVKCLANPPMIVSKANFDLDDLMKEK